MRLVVLTEIPEDSDLRRQWNALVHRVSQPQVFYTWEWSLAVQRAYRAELHPLIFLAYDEEECLCAVASLAVDDAGRASFLCANTGDYCDFLSLPKDKAEFVGRVLAALRKRGIGHITLTNLPADSDSVAALRRALPESRYRMFARTAYHCAQVSLGGLERRAGETQPFVPGHRMVRRKLNALRRLAPARLEHGHTWNQIEPLLPQFMDAHVARFQVIGRVSNMARPERRLFLEELTKLLAECGWVALTRLMSGDRATAWNYGFQFQGTWFWYQPTFDSAMERYSPGFCLLAMMVEEATENPALDTVDLGLGAEEYKDKFANQSRETLYVTLRASALQHVREIVRYRAAQVIKANPHVEAGIRAVLDQRFGHSPTTTDKERKTRGEAAPIAQRHPDADAEAATAANTPVVAEKLSFQTEMGRIARQSGIVFAGTVFTAVLGYGFKVYLARWLGAEALGLYALGITMVSFLGIFNVIGIPESAVRFVALYSAQKNFDALRGLLWNGLWMLLAASLISATLFLELGPWVGTHFYHSPQLARYLPWFVPIMVTGVMSTYFGSILAGYREIGRRTMITKFVSSPITMVVSVLLITLGAALPGYLAAQIVSAAVVTLLLASLVWKLTPVEARLPDIKRLGIERHVWSFAAAMFGVGLMQFLMGQTDRVALGVYRGAREVGIYAVVAGLVAYETIILQSVNQIFAPVIADVHSRGEHELLGRLFQTLTKWMLGLTFPLAIVMIIFARPIMRMFGHEFEAGWSILVIGTFGQLVNCGVGSVGYLLLMSGNQIRLVRVQAVMAIVMVVLTFELVPHWGALGAAIAAAITNIGMNTLNLLQVRRSMKLSPYNLSYWKLLPPIGTALGIAMVVNWASASARAEWAVILSALALSYLGFSIVALAMGLDTDDRLISDAVWARARGFFGR